MKQKVFKNNFVYYLAITYSVIVVALFTLSNDNKQFLQSNSKSIQEYIYFLFNNAVSAIFIISIYFLLKRKLISLLFLRVATILFSFTILFLLVVVLKARVIDYSWVVFSTTLLINGIFLYLIHKFKFKKSMSDEIENIGKSNNN